MWLSNLVAKRQRSGTGKKMYVKQNNVYYTNYNYNNMLSLRYTFSIKVMECGNVLMELPTFAKNVEITVAQKHTSGNRFPK